MLWSTTSQAVARLGYQTLFLLLRYVAFYGHRDRSWVACSGGPAEIESDRYAEESA